MSYHLLKNWIKKNRPELDTELSNLPVERALAVLNRETGLNVQPHEQIHETCCLFLEALKVKQGNAQ